jgi:WD40 repeat protein
MNGKLIQSSVSDFTLTPCTSPQVQATGLPGCGTFSGVPLSVCSLVTKASSLLSPSVQMDGIWPRQASPSMSHLRTLLNGSPLGEDLAINLWDLGSGRRVKKMVGHTASVYSLVFSAESSVLVSGGADWTVRCWDVKDAGGPPETSRTNGIGSSAGSHHSKDPGPDVVETWVVHNISLYFYLMKYCRKDLLATFPTKRTPITTVHFTPRNLCLVAGPHLSTTPR